VTATTAIGSRHRIAVGPRVWAWRVAAFVALAAVALPGLITPMPPLLDYPNHYVRIWLLAGGINTAPVSNFYQTDWSAAWTNVGIDLIARGLGPIIGARTLAPLLLGLALALPPFGAILLNRRLFGGWKAWQLGIPLTAFATTLLAGFLNYHIGIGLALVAAAFDPWMQRRSTPTQMLLARLAIATGLLIVHIFSLGFYAVLLGGLALGPSLARLWSAEAARGAALRILAIAVTVAAPLVAFFVLAPHPPGNGSAFLEWGPTTLKYKLDVLRCALGTYSPTVDYLFFAPLLGLVVVAAFRRSLGAHQGLLVSTAGLVVLSMIAPQWAAETAWVDTRLPIMALLTLLAALNPQVGGQRVTAVVATALLALTVGRATWIGHIWDERQADVRSIQRALAQVPAGSAVMPIEHRPSVRGRRAAPEGRYFHFGASVFHLYTLTVVERQAFSPLVFTQPGKQPLRVKPPYDVLSVPNGGRSPTPAVLRGETFHPSWIAIAPYLPYWRQRFDYALMLNADLGEDVNKDVMPPELKLVADEGFARLYKVEKRPR
jgi:hypothetical protein